MRGSIFPALSAGLLFFAACSSSGEPGPDVEGGENAGKEDGDYIGSEWKPEPPGPLHEVVVDGKEQLSIYTQKQHDILNKGPIEREDYESAFLDFVSCVEEDGYTVEYTSLDDNVIKYSMRVEADPNEYCYTSHFVHIDADWQVAQPEDYYDEQKFYINCLEKHDVEPAYAEATDTEEEGVQRERLDALLEQVETHNADCQYIDPAYGNAP